MKDLSNNNIIHVKKDGVEYIQFRKLLEYPNVVHAISLKPLDYGSYKNYEGKKHDIQKNYDLICNTLGINSDTICRPNQTHTDVVKALADEEPWEFMQDFTDIDGVTTNRKDRTLMLTYADCTPLLFFDPVKNVIANTHSGWKGTVQYIGYKTVENMIEHYGCNPADILCFIGPTIRQCHFEVMQDVRDIFYNAFKDKLEVEKYIINDKDGEHYYIDTVGINTEMLKQAGLKEENIIDSGICTVDESGIMFSYRAEKANNGNELGRNAALITLI